GDDRCGSVIVRSDDERAFARCTRHDRPELRRVLAYRALLHDGALRPAGRAARIHLIEVVRVRAPVVARRLARPAAPGVTAPPAPGSRPAAPSACAIRFARASASA